jgi:predicted RNase H-like HicB family nuclease
MSVYEVKLTSAEYEQMRLRLANLERDNTQLREESASHTESSGMQAAEIRSLTAKISDITLSRTQERSRVPGETVYTLSIRREGGDCYASIAELPGLLADGPTPAKAIADLAHAFDAWMTAAAATSRPAFPERQRTVDEYQDEIDDLKGEREQLVALLRRYRNETPAGHQPHMIALEVDALIGKGPK